MLLRVSAYGDCGGIARLSCTWSTLLFFLLIFLHTFTFQLLDKPWTQVSSLLPPRFLPSFFIAHRVQQSHCSSNFHRVLLTHALALSASQIVHNKNSPRIYTSMHSAGLELTKLTCTRLEDNLIRHRGDRLNLYHTLTPPGPDPIWHSVTTYYSTSGAEI